MDMRTEAPSSRRARPSLLVILCLAIWSAAAFAHDLRLTEVRAAFEEGGTYRLDLVCDLDALALGVDPSSDSAELAATLAALPTSELERRVEGLRDYLARRVRIRFDGEPARPEITLPERGLPDRPPDTYLGLTARFEGRVPEGAQDFVFSASRSFPPVHLTVAEAGFEPVRHVLEPGARSEPYRFGEARPAPGVLATAGRYLALGFEHIVPLGVDHMLFVLGLFLLAPRPRPLLWQVTAFTAAHTLTLGLAAAGLVTLPPRLVEPLIALSIAYVGVENLLTRELRPWRPALVFAFGLLHGLGFAGVLGELGLPRGAELSALLGFNLGVELGQLAVLAAAFGLLGPFRHRLWYRRRLTLPLSLAVAVTGLWWAVARV